jgi:hypothetical protein
MEGIECFLVLLSLSEVLSQDPMMIASSCTILLHNKVIFCVPKEQLPLAKVAKSVLLQLLIYHLLTVLTLRRNRCMLIGIPA